MIIKIHSILLLLLVNFSIHAQDNSNLIKEVLMPQFSELLDSAQLNGSILIYDYNQSTFYSNDFNWAKQGFLPASTFKIINSIIALETGTIKSDSTVLKWLGEKRYLKSWEKDLTFKEAFQLSCVPCYQDIARNIGVARMKEYLNIFDYTEMIFDSLTLENFWLEGESKISQHKQIEFLEKFYFSKLPISNRTTEIVKDIMLIEKKDSSKLSGKTGWTVKDDINIGWFVGYLESANNVYFFATNVTPTKEFNKDDFLKARVDLTKKAFKQLNLF